MNVTYLPEDGKLYEVDLYVFVILLSLYCSISILAILGNGFVIWIISLNRNMKNATNYYYYIANLAVADILIAMFVIPFQFQAALLQRWNLPHFMCAFCPFVRTISITVSVLSLSAIAVDRHRAIINPFKTRPSKKAAMLVIISIWSVAMLIGFPMAYAMEVIWIKGEDTQIPFCFHENLSERVMITYNILLVVMQYILPLSIISWAYWGMGVSLWGASAPGNAQESRDVAILRKKKKAIKMLIVVVSIFALCWLPLQTYNVLQYYFPLNSFQYINVFWFTFDWLAMSNSCYNPFIYVLYNSKFKREFHRSFGKFWPFKTDLLIRDLSTLSSNSYSWRRDSVHHKHQNNKLPPRSHTLTREPLIPALV